MHLTRHASERESSRSPLYRQLKPGPGRSSEEVGANQCTRLRGAMVELVAERGYRGTTVRGVSQLAGVSTRTFYAHFANVDECFASTYSWIMSDAARQSPVASGGGEERVHARLHSLLEGFAKHPKASRLALVECFTGGPEVLENVRGAARGLERLLSGDFASSPDPTAVSPSVLRGTVAGALRVARTRLLTGDPSELSEAARQLGDWAITLAGQHFFEWPLPAISGTAFASAPDARRLDVANEHDRVLAAVSKLGGDGGYAQMTISRVRSEAGVSRRAFDAQFAGLEECFFEAIETLALGAASRAVKERTGAASWESGIFRAVVAFSAEIAADPVLAQLGLVDIFDPGRNGLRCRESFITQGAERLRAAAPARRCPTVLAAEASMAAAWAIIDAEHHAGRTRDLIEIAPTIAFVLLAPGTGVVGTVREIRAEQVRIGLSQRRPRGTPGRG